MSESDPSPSSTPPPPPSSSANNVPPAKEMTPQNWCTLIHASGFAGLLFPSAHIIAPLVIWLIKKDSNPQIDAVGRNVLNFQVSFTIYAVLAGMLAVVLVGIILLPIVGIVWLILMIMGTVKASNGENYIYPLSIRMF